MITSVSNAKIKDVYKRQGDDRYYHLVLLAENNQGYSNLMKIVSKAFVEGFYYKPRVDLELLEKYHEGIIALSACLAGEVARYLARGMYEDAKIAALRYQDIFGKGNFFLELQDHGIPEQQTVNQQLLRMHRETGIDLDVYKRQQFDPMVDCQYPLEWKCRGTVPRHFLSKNAENVRFADL